MSQRRGFLPRMIGVAVFVLLVAPSHREWSDAGGRRGQSRAAEPAKARGFGLQWRPLEPLPDPVGVAGPFVGVHGGGLIVAGGANFAAVDAPELWETPKRFHAAAHVLSRAADGRFSWRSGFAIARPLAYGGSASTPAGVVCVGGDDGETASSAAFLLTWDAEKAAVRQAELPALPAPSTAGGAALVGRHVYVVAGLSAPGLESAGDRLWRVDGSPHGVGKGTGEELPRGAGRCPRVSAGRHAGVRRRSPSLRDRRPPPAARHVGAWWDRGARRPARVQPDAVRGRRRHGLAPAVASPHAAHGRRRHRHGPLARRGAGCRRRQPAAGRCGRSRVPAAASGLSAPSLGLRHRAGCVGAGR
ncbi:MAG: hypothetical protein ACKOTB_15305 [Planctomycetia bacterium]